MVIDIKQEALVPTSFKFFGFLLMIGGLIAFRFYGDIGILIFRNVLGIGLISLGIFLATAYYGLRIDIDSRTYTVYTFAFGMKFGKPVKFGNITNFYINRVSTSSKMTSYGGHRHATEAYSYKAFMKLDNGDKVHMDTDLAEARLEEKLEAYKQKLKAITQLEPS
jgi:hypothetical protein